MRMPKWIRRLAGVTLLAGAALAGCGDSDAPSSSGLPPPSQPPLQRQLPLPSQLSRAAYQERLYAFLGDLDYRALGWRGDKHIRDSGPYRDGGYYGTHPAVRVYYSPEAIEWLVGGRQGEMPDGTMIIKEMYPPPAARYRGLAETALPAPTQWTVMVRDRARSVDGWFWAYFASNPKG